MSIVPSVLRAPRFVPWAFCSLLWMLAPAPASAQPDGAAAPELSAPVSTSGPRPDSDCDPDLAREAFEAGLRFAGERRLADARDAYSRSLALCPRVPTGYNLAVVLQQLGSEPEALEISSRLGTGEFGPLDREQRQIIRALHRELERSTMLVLLRVSGAPSVAVTVNGTPAGRASEDQIAEIPARRGAVAIGVTAEDGRSRVVRREVTGARVEVSIELPLSEALGRIVAVSEDPDAELEIVGVGAGQGRLVRHVAPDEYVVRLRDGSDERNVAVLRGTTERVMLDGSVSVFESPWFWLVGALVVAGAVVTSVLLLSPSAEPNEDPVWGRVELMR